MIQLIMFTLIMCSIIELKTVFAESTIPDTTLYSNYFPIIHVPPLQEYMTRVVDYYNHNYKVSYDVVQDWVQSLL